MNMHEKTDGNINIQMGDTMNTKWVIVIAIGMMLMTGCGNDEPKIVCASGDCMTPDEIATYWDTANADAADRENAKRQNRVVVKWVGDWDDDTRLAMFHGLTHYGDIRVGANVLNVVGMYQMTIKRFDGNDWNTIKNINDNMQPGDVIIITR